MQVRTRFAPSPTGFLHVGSVRTALFSWLFARHHQGQFILRIEDTDQERSTAASTTAILEGLAWLGLDYEEGPFYQTQRYDRYNAVAQQLLDEGKAYRCYCSKERLEALREEQLAAKKKPRYDGHCRHRPQSPAEGSFVLRFKNPQEGVVSFTDQVYGTIHINNNELDDLIIVRSDGHPTYNFVVVVDDWDMGITHVIRGDDHINNTPRQINLFNALGAPLPVFAHLPMILGEDGKRLSKRHGAVNVLQFKELGVLPHALLNYLVRLGWSSGDQEIFSREEMIAAFNLNQVSRGVSMFNYEKLYWLNQHYLKSEPSESVLKALQWQFEQHGMDWRNGPPLAELLKLQADRCQSLSEICEKSRYFYEDTLLYDEAAIKKHCQPALIEPLNALHVLFQALENWQKDDLQECINDICVQFSLNMGKIAQPLRIAVTGSTMSPSIDATLYLIGKTRVLQRLKRMLNQNF
jgi:glutamyl-tRNA synthetase